ncbi:MAG: hypothetical protein ACAI25_21100 [Planctomycetota bacterium]
MAEKKQSHTFRNLFICLVIGGAVAGGYYYKFGTVPPWEALKK